LFSCFLVFLYWLISPENREAHARAPPGGADQGALHEAHKAAPIRARALAFRVWNFPMKGSLAGFSGSLSSCQRYANWFIKEL